MTPAAYPRLPSAGAGVMCMKQTRKLGRGLEDFSHLFLSCPDAKEVSGTPEGENYRRETDAVISRPHTICIAGERGAGEKSFLTVGLAEAFAAQGKRVVVFDADFSLPRLCMLMEGVPSNSLLHLITHQGPGKNGLREHEGITLITVDADVSSLAVLAPRERRLLVDGFGKSVDGAGIVLVMISGASINQTGIFIQSADDVVVVTPRPVAEMINAYGLIKKILYIDDQARIGIVTSKTLAHQADAVYEKMQRVAKKFLNKSLLHYGYLPDDAKIENFLKRTTSASETPPSSEIAGCIAAIGQSLLAGGVKPEAAGRRTLVDYLFALSRE